MKPFNLPVYLLFSLAAILSSSHALGKVNVYTGFYTRAWVDLGVAGSTSELRVIRTWNPNSKIKSHVFGENWCSNWDVELRDLGSSVPKVVSCDRFAVLQAVKGQPGMYVSTLNPAARLQKMSDSSYEFKLGGETMFFDRTGLLVSWRDRHSRKTNLLYEGNHLSQLQSDEGQILKFKFQKGNLEQVEKTKRSLKTAQLMVKYQYDNDHLVAVLEVGKDPVHLSWDAEGRLTEISSSKPTEIISYVGPHSPVVARVTSPMGCSTRYTLNLATQNEKVSTSKTEKACPGRQLKTTTYEFVMDSAKTEQTYLQSSLQSTVNATEKLDKTFDPVSKRLQSVETADGKETYTYDGAGRVSLIQNDRQSESLKLGYADGAFNPNLVTWSRKGKTSSLHLSYNASSQIHKITEGTMVLTLTYDRNDRLVSIRREGKLWAQANYGKEGELSSLRFANRLPASLIKNSALNPESVLKLLSRLVSIRQSDSLV